MTKIDIVSDEEARKMLRENAENRKKLEDIHLKGFDLSSAEKALNTVPVTNKLYDRQEQLRKEKEEKKKKLEEQRLAHLAQIKMQKDIDDGPDF